MSLLMEVANWGILGVDNWQLTLLDAELRRRVSEMKITVGHRPFSVLFSLMTDQLLPCSAIMASHKRRLLPVSTDVCHVLDNFCLLTRMSDDLFRIQSNNYGADDQHLNGRPIL